MYQPSFNFILLLSYEFWGRLKILMKLPRRERNDGNRKRERKREGAKKRAMRKKISNCHNSARTISIFLFASHSIFLSNLLLFRSPLYPVIIQEALKLHSQIKSHIFFTGRNNELYKPLRIKLRSINWRWWQIDNVPCGKPESNGTVSGNYMEIECCLWVYTTHFQWA